MCRKRNERKEKATTIGLRNALRHLFGFMYAPHAGTAAAAAVLSRLAVAVALATSVI